jgi:hypothetical protein
MNRISALLKAADGRAAQRFSEGFSGRAAARTLLEYGKP